MKTKQARQARIPILCRLGIHRWHYSMKAAGGMRTDICICCGWDRIERIRYNRTDKMK